MKTILRGMTLVSALALGVAGAQAADLVAAPVVEAASEAYNWTGFYAGVHGGYGTGDHNSDWDWGYETYSYDLSGGFGGVQIGYNHQFASQWVAGVEADFSLSSLDHSFIDGAWTVEAKVDWFGTLRGRLGYAFDNALVYGTAGAAYGRVKLDEAWMNQGNSYAISHADTHWGWTAGAGLELGISRNVTLKAEYLYVDLGTSSRALDMNDYRNLDVEAKFHAFKAGLNYRF
jgi:outer membrane immunogenic protein